MPPRYQKRSAEKPEKAPADLISQLKQSIRYNEEVLKRLRQKGVITEGHSSPKPTAAGDEALSGGH